MATIEFTNGRIDEQKQAELTAGFEAHNQSQLAPSYNKEHVNWTVQNESGQLIAALTAELLWEWLYIDELWVDERCRGTGLGKQLIAKAEEYSRAQKLSGLWLWTQSWQAPMFYQRLGFEEFTRFESFPTGHDRIGLRKKLSYRT